LSFALNRAVTGPAPWGFHLVNILLHGGVTVLAYRLSRLVLGKRTLAFMAGLLFAVHPIHTEAIANIVGRAELIVAAAVLGALITGVGRRSPSPARIAATGGLFAVGILAKENAIALLPIWALLTAYLWPEGGLRVRVAAALRDRLLWVLVAI